MRLRGLARVGCALRPTTWCGCPSFWGLRHDGARDVSGVGKIRRTISRDQHNQGRTPGNAPTQSRQQADLKANFRSLLGRVNFFGRRQLVDHAVATRLHHMPPPERPGQRIHQRGVRSRGAEWRHAARRQHQLPPPPPRGFRTASGTRTVNISAAPVTLRPSRVRPVLPSPALGWPALPAPASPLPPLCPAPIPEPRAKRLPPPSAGAAAPGLGR